MKYQIMLGILFTLLSARKKSAGALAAKYHCSVRSVYRYVEELIVAGIPIDVGRGANGGIWISDAYKLPKGFMTKEEYARTVEAMLAMLEQTGDETLRAALEKITSGMKREKSDAALSGNILVDSGTWGDERRFSEKLAITDRAISEREALEIDYVDREGETSKRKILPHLLVYKQNIWYVYAFCNTRNAFRLFKLGRMRSILQTGETFERLDFSRDEIPLSFWRDDENDLDVRLQIAPEKLPFAEEWLGVENIRRENGLFLADVTLPDDDALIGKILSAGAGLTVLAPPELKTRVQTESERIAAQYRA